MKHVPKYLMPRTAPIPGTGAAVEDGEGANSKPGAFVPFRNEKTRGRGRGRGRGGRGRGGAGGGRKKDPLKSFK